MNLLAIIDDIKLRTYWIERGRYMLTEEQMEKLEEIRNNLAIIENDIGNRA